MVEFSSWWNYLVLENDILPGINHHPPHLYLQRYMYPKTKYRKQEKSLNIKSWSVSKYLWPFLSFQHYWSKWRTCETQSVLWGWDPLHLDPAGADVCFPHCRPSPMALLLRAGPCFSSLRKTCSTGSRSCASWCEPTLSCHWSCSP